MTPEVSIIVGAYNNADALNECLSSLRAQTYPNKRIIVVCDTSSSDETEKVVDSFVESSGESSVSIKCRGVGRSRARNIGWRAVRSAIVMFADGDDLYEPEYLSKAVSALQSTPGAGGVCLGGIALVRETNMLYNYYRAYGATDVRFKPHSSASPDWAWVYWRVCVEKVNGFDEELTQAEDKEMCSRVKEMGYGIAYVGGVNWYHRKPATLGKFVKKECLSGKRRVVYELRTQQYRSVLADVSPVIFVISGVASALLVGVTNAVLILCVGLILYSGILLSKKRSSSRSSRDLLGFAVLTISGKLASSAGCIYGLALLSLNRAKIVRLDFGRF